MIDWDKLATQYYLGRLDTMFQDIFIERRFINAQGDTKWIIRRQDKKSRMIKVIDHVNGVWISKENSERDSRTLWFDYCRRVYFDTKEDAVLYLYREK